MPACENQKAAVHSMPRGPNPVEDRRMTLDIQCDMDAEYASTLLGLGDGKQRKGAAARKFLLCYNHSELFRDIDRELVEEGWAPAHTEPRPTRLY